MHGRGVRGDDHEFAGGVQDLRGWWQFTGIQHAQRRQFGKERDLEGAATQEFGGFFVGFAASGEDEGLDAEEVALDEQDFFFVPVALAAQTGDGGVIGLAVGVVPQPQGGGEGSGAFAVVVKGDFGFAAKSGRGRDGMGAALPQGVEVVEPEWPVAAVRCGDVLQVVLELLPQGAVFGLCGGIVGRFAVFTFFGVDAVRIERAQRVAVVQLAAGFVFRVVAEVDLLEQGQQAVVVRRVILGEGVTRKAGGDAVGGDDDLLQEGVRVVLCRRAQGKRGKFVAHKVGQVLLEGVPSESGVVVRRGFGTVNAVAVVLVGIRGIVRGFHAGALGELTEVVQKGGKGDAAGDVFHGFSLAVGVGASVAV